MKSIPDSVVQQRLFFDSQATKPISYRLKQLKALKAELIRSEKALCDALYNDFKKSHFETFISEFGIVLSELNLAIKRLKHWAKPKRVKASLLTFPSKDYIYSIPYGTVLVIAPWNYPFLLAIEPLIMAIAAGNTVVLKPSELTPHTSEILNHIISKVFPPEHALVIQGGVDTATTLLEQQWDYIFFTGSTKVGKIIAEAAAVHLTPTTLELGGKSPCIIDDTVSMPRIAKRLVWGKLLNAGQTCIAPDYVIVKANIKLQLIEAIKNEIIKAYTEAPEVSPDFPRIINSRHLKRLKGLIANEKVLFGGQTNINDNYLAPTIIDNPELNSPIMTDEIFGPILPILTYNALEDITAIVSKINKPLAFYIFSKDKVFTEKLLRIHPFGGSVVNDTLVHFGNPKLPFGGIGTSGMGKYHGKFGFDTFSHYQAVLKRGTWIDPPFRYAPYKGKLQLLKKAFKYFG